MKKISKQQIKKIKTYLFWFAEGVSVGLIPYCHIIATNWRGHEAFGSEFLLPLIPVLFAFVTHKDGDKK